MQTQPTLLVDGVSSIAIHNGVARVQFMRLGLDGWVFHGIVTGHFTLS